ncbi:MAG: DHA2 family efflux MFS transporter permease subunit [Micrococcaceae bacterium]
MKKQTATKPMLTLIPMLLAFFMIMVDTTIVNIAIPTLLKHFNTDLTTLLWVNSAYALTTAVPLLLTGRLGDRFGQDKLFLAGTIVFTLASAWCGFAHTVHELIIARAVQGLGGAMLVPQTMAMIAKIFPPKERGKALGFWGAVAGIATIFGPLIGGVIVDSLGWEWIFFVNIPFGIIAVIMAIKLLPNFEGQPIKLDFLSIVLSGVGMFCITFGLQEGHQYNWGKITGVITVWNLIIVGVVFMVLFIWRQKTEGKDSLLPLRLFRSRNFNLANIAGFAASFAMLTFSLPFTLYLQTGLGMDPTKAALVFLPMSLVSGALSPYVGKLSQKIEPRFIAAGGFGLYTLGTLGIILTMNPQSNLLPVILCSLITGVGLAGVFSPISNIVTQSVPVKDSGISSAAFNTIRQIGGVLGSAIVASVMSTQIKDQLTNAAYANANNIPAPARDQVVNGVINAAGGEFSAPPTFHPPAGTPATVIESIKNTVDTILRQGITDATSHTLYLVVIVMLVGTIAALLMKNLGVKQADEQPTKKEK